jgi:hypothetical protein
MLRSHRSGLPQVTAPLNCEGTEFLDAETKRQKSSSKTANARRDQNPGNEWPEIPAETLYSARDRKPAVCGDWVVVCAVRCERVSTEDFPVLRENNRVIRFFLAFETVFTSEKPLCRSSFLLNSLRKLTG